MADKIEIPIIWSDEHILVIDKPAGLLALPDGYDPTATHVKAILSPQYEPLWIVHRLDRYTSGVMVLARSASAHRQLNTQFQERQVKKIYLVLVKGDPTWDRKVVDQPLRTNAGRRHRTIVDLLNGKPSVTRFEVLQRYGSYALVEATPETGRRHQIRAHLASQGYPLVCDDLYNDGGSILSSGIDHNLSGEFNPEEPILNRPGLHAQTLELKHPITGKHSHFGAQVPRDLRLTLDLLRNQSR
jgi:23S rRNA pseudouridine955/2504/2580 synthase/23S rRNA pseudouridine1911/1915/1917 synthase